MGFIVVFLGAGLGGMLRHGVGMAVLKLRGPGFPIGTLLINIVGSASMGVLVGLLAARDSGTGLRLFLATGVLGGFTTFSTFSLDVVTLYERGSIVAALAYVVLSLLGGVLSLWLMLVLLRQGVP